MKLAPLLIPCVLLMLSATVLADIAVYNGIQVVKTTSLDGTSTVVDKITQVVDLENGSLVVIALGFDKATRTKTFSVGQPSAILINTFQDSRGAKRSFTTFAQVSSTTDPATTITELTSFRQTGANLQVIIEGNTKVPLPKNMHGVSWIASTDGVDGTEEIASGQVEIVTTVNLNEPASRTSNNAGDTLALAVDRLKTDLISKGYVEVPN